MNPSRFEFSQHGVTLVELVILIVVVAIVAVPFSSQLITSSRSFALNNYLQSGVAEAKACAEHVLYTERVFGYDAITGNTICDNLTAPISPLVRSVKVINTDSVSEPACPSGTIACKHVEIDILVSGQSINKISFLFFK